MDKSTYFLFHLLDILEDAKLYREKTHGVLPVSGDCHKGLSDKKPEAIFQVMKTVFISIVVMVP